MRLEGQHGRGPAKRFGPLLRDRDDGSMTAVNAVEIAHGDHGAMQRRIGRAVAHDQKAFPRHRASIGQEEPAGGRCRRPGAKSTRCRTSPAGRSQRAAPSRPDTTDGCTNKQQTILAINLIFKPARYPAPTSTRQAPGTMALDPATPVLVVDDYATMVHIIRNLLKQIGFDDVDDANDGSTALAKM